MTALKDIVFETDQYWVKRVPKGFEVYKTGLTHSTRVAIIGYTGDKGLQRAKQEIARREGSNLQRSAHTTMTKKSPAQLDREIVEALANKDKPTTWKQREALYERGARSDCTDFLLSYLPYAGEEPYSSRSGQGSYEECYDTRDLAKRRLQQLRKDGRIEWAKIYQHDHRYPLQRKLVDEWEERRRAHSTVKTYNAPKPDLTVRQINAIVRAADGRNIYLIRTRLGDETVQRITRARTKGRETEVRSLATGNWIPVLPERGDKLEVR